MRQRAPLIGVALAVLLAVGFWFLLYQPRNEEQAELEAETAQLQTRQQQLSNEIAQLEEIQANEVEIRAALARLEEYVPSGLAQPTTIRQFQQSADAAGVEILAVSFAVPEPAEGAPPTGQPDSVLGSIPVTMTLEGGYFQMVDFLRRIEVDVPRAVLVESVAAGEAEAGFPLLSTTWSGRLFALIPAGPDAAVAAPPPEEPAPEAGAEGADGQEEEGT
jgi:Tfp pilus assembly protein PilO